MNKIIIVSKNIGVVSKEELKPLASCLMSELNVNIEFSTPKMSGTQVTLHDVIEFWIIVEGLTKGKVSEIVYETLVKEFVSWAKAKLRKEKKPRPKTVTIYDQYGKPITAVTVNEHGETEKKKKIEDDGYKPKYSEKFEEESGP
jgi:hypothetical protein